MSDEDHNEPPTKEGLPEVPEVVQKFIQRFQKSITSASLSSNQSVYKYISEKLSLQETSVIAEFVEHDKLFLMVYEQIYNRQIHSSKKPPTLNHRIRSFENYQNLFYYLLAEKASLQFTLPDQCLWDIIDEFVTQYASFCHYRENLKNKTEEEIESLKANEKLWDPLYVLETLFKLEDAAKTEIKSEAKVPSSLLYIKLGHFAIYGLLRVYTLQTDYFNAIKILDDRRNFPTKMSKVVFSSLEGCQFSVSYHAGFAYTMMQRYTDAIHVIVNTLVLFENNIDSYKEKSYQNKKIQKYAKRMLKLLCICVVLRHISDTITYSFIMINVINKLFKDYKCDEKVKRIELELEVDSKHPEFKSCFIDSCPEFVLPKSPNLEELREDYSKEAIENQLRIFMQEVNYHKLIPNLKFELEVEMAQGKTISIVNFMKNNMMMETSFHDFEASLQRPNSFIKTEGIRHLLRAKHKQVNAVRTEDPMSSGLDFILETASGTDFFIDGKNINVFGDGFLSIL